MRHNAGLRKSVAALLIVAGLVTGAVGVPALYVRSQIIPERKLEDRLVAAVQTPVVREVASRQLVNGLIGAGATDLLSVRPVLVPAIEALLDSPSFSPVVRLAARDAHNVFIRGRDDSLVLELGNGGALLISALRSISPQIAELVPKDANAEILNVQPDEPALRAVRRIARLDDAGFWLPIAALALLVAGVAVAPNRRGALGWTGGGIALVGGLLALLLAIARELTVRKVEADVLIDADARAALKVLWDALLGDLSRWAGMLVLGGAMLAVIGAGGFETAAYARRARDLGTRLIRTPRTRGLRGLRGVAVATLGILLALEPALVGSVLAAIAGFAAVIWGLSEAASALEARATSAPTMAGRRFSRWRLVLPAVGAVLVFSATAAAALLITGPGPRGEQAAAEATPRSGCLGSRDLCGARLNEVTFAATHNSFSAADEPGWIFPNQRYGISRQLDDGIRSFFLDLHLGVRDSSGVVRTDLAGEGQDRNRVGKAIGSQGVATAEYLFGRIGGGSLRGTRGVYMCHTLCELGSEPAVTQLKVFERFLADNPGEVLVFDIEPYVTPELVERTFRAAGLLPYVATLDRDRPLPTLGEMVSSGKRLVVLTESDGGSPSWYMPMFTFVQDTPLGAQRASQFSCRLYRGAADNPLFAIYHWIDRFPPLPGANAAIGGKVLRDRVDRCSRQRDLTPNIVAVDFYNTSGVVALAGARNRAVARTVARRTAAVARAAAAGRSSAG